MESLALVLQPYKETVATLAGVITSAQFFTGVFICKDIYKQGSTHKIDSMPFVGGLTMGTLMYKYGQMLNDPAMLWVNISAIALNIMYLMVYFKYSLNKSQELYKPLAMGVALIAFLFGYTNYESPHLVEYRYGLITTVLCLALIASPLLGLKEIIATKDASSIPAPMTGVATVVTFLWLLYGIILRNNFMVVQNIVGFALCIVQMYLIFKYPGSKSSQTDSVHTRNVGFSAKKKIN